jgi:ABC-type multidrug transport system fused ATPase/permease subunit
MQEEMQKDDKPSMVTKRTLYSWVLEKNVRWQCLLVLLVTVTVGARVLPLEMQKRIINKAIGLGDRDLLLLYSLLFLGSVLLASSLKFVINLLQAYIGQQTLKRMRTDLYAHILRLPLLFFRTIQPGQVVNAQINELATISGFVGSAVSVPLINVFTLLAMGGYLFYLNPLLASLSFVLYPLQVFVVPKLQKRGNEANRYRVNISRAISGNIGEVISGVHEVHGHAGYDLENDKFSQQAQMLLDANVRMNAYRYGIKFANNLFENIGPFILFLVGGSMTIRGHFDLGALVAFLSAYSSLSEPWRELMEFYQLLEDSRVRYKNVMATFDITPEHRLAPVGRDVYRLRGEIDIRGMSYQTVEGTKLLDGISLNIHSGEMVALVGFSGSGKSTLVQVISQLIPYSDGNIHIDGFEVRDLTKLDMAENMGIVPQHPFIFSGTIRDNLLYSSQASLRNGMTRIEVPDLDRIIEVVQQVGIFVDILKFGLQATIAPEQHADLVANILAMRPVFREHYGTQHDCGIEFFDPSAYLDFGSIAQNIVFGDFADHQAKHEKAFRNKKFLAYLEQVELLETLIAFGATIAAATVPILKYAVQTPEIYADSPIKREDLDEYVVVVADIAAWGLGNLKTPARMLLLKLALDFAPGRHKTVRMPSSLQHKILKARAGLPEYVNRTGQSALQFYDPNQYIQSRSIRDNILFGQPKMRRAGTMERINQNLIQLLIEEGALERIVEQGLDFQVGSMGEYLSGGQRQKLALARVFLKQPAIYILDEATSALDNASQSRTQNFLQTLRGKHTILSVVHRLDTIAHYDRILVMKAGKVVENGSYEDLMAAKGVLYGLIGSA